jgi:hypothetical protein
MAEISVEIKKQILAQEVQTYENTLYLLQVRYRVNKKLDNKDAMKAAEDELIKIEQALDELRGMQKEVTDEI